MLYKLAVDFCRNMEIWLESYALVPAKEVMSTNVVCKICSVWKGLIKFNSIALGFWHYIGIDWLLVMLFNSTKASYFYGIDE